MRECLRVRTVVEYNINMRVHAAVKWRQVPNIQHKYYTMSGSHELLILPASSLFVPLGEARGLRCAPSLLYYYRVYNSDLSNVQEYHV